MACAPATPAETREDRSPAGPDPIDAELHEILTSFDTSYVWNYGNVKAGLPDLYEKASASSGTGRPSSPARRRSSRRARSFRRT